MKHPVRSKLIAYGITAALGLLAAFGILSLRSFSGSMIPQERYRALSDAFFLPGLMMVLLGMLSWIASKDAFSGITFLFRNLVRSLIPGARLKYPHETYYDYLEERRQRREERRKEELGIAFLFITGAVFMAAGAVFLVLFYQVFDPSLTAY